jgi:hypothetical protein
VTLEQSDTAPLGGKDLEELVKHPLEELPQSTVCREGTGGPDEVGQDAVAASLLRRLEVGFRLLQVRDVSRRDSLLGAQRRLSSRSLVVHRQVMAPQIDGVSRPEGTVRAEALAIQAGAIPAA